MFKKLLLGFLALLVVAQFIRPAKNRSNRPQPDDIFERIPAPDEIRVSLERACYDCHSNNTRYPWYAEVQPLGWWLAHHISEGTSHVNFSELGRAEPKRVARKLEQAFESIEDGSMPLPSYTWIHQEARLSAEQKKRILDWLEAAQEKLQPSSE